MLPTLPVYKIMALICSSVRSLECLTGFWGLGIASVSRNWGAKGGEVRKKTQVREAAYYKSGDPKKRTRTFEMMTGHDYH